MEVYIEWTYMINAFIILWTIEILCFLLNQIISIKKLMFYMLAYNISIILLYVDMFIGFILIYDLVISVLLFRKLTYIYYPLYVFIYVSITSFMQLMIKDSFIFQGVLLLSGLSLSTYLFMSIVVVLFIYFYLYYCKNKIHGNYVEVSLHDKHCLGFIDNGNHVTYKGSPVIFMNKAYIHEEYIDDIEIEVVNDKQMIHLVMVKDISINHYVLHDIYVGVLHDCEYDCILNNQLLGGLL
ncbi:MAG: hypothetical protein LUG12_11070 [Erysipelotrichaceae bacterium]|nr:hypothetical protein [Erysipelotrichaceae bacterium]